MYIDSNLIPIVAISVGCVIAVTRIVTSTISRHRLDVEKIRADAMVRAEEVRSRNELELERLMRQDRNGNNTGNGAGQTDPDSELRNTKERIRD